MTENEAKEMLAIHYEFLRESWKPYPDEKVLDALRIAISSFDKIQQYRAIGTVEELKAREAYIKQILWERDIAVGQLEEIGVSLGEKMDSVKEAMERQRAKKPDIWGDGYDEYGNIIYDMYNCPNCGKSYEVDYDDYKHCPECGQAIDRCDFD